MQTKGPPLNLGGSSLNSPHSSVYRTATANVHDDKTIFHKNSLQFLLLKRIPRPRSTIARASLFHLPFPSNNHFPQDTTHQRTQMYRIAFPYDRYKPHGPCPTPPKWVRIPFLLVRQPKSQPPPQPTHPGRLVEPERRGVRDLPPLEARDVRGPP